MIGRIVGDRYEIIEKLGGGGMAVVYRGQDTLLSRSVTIKVLREQLASDAEFIRKFRREAQSVARLSHPNIVSIYDVGQDGDLHYLVMEYVEGKNLKQIIKEHQRLNPSEAVDYAIQISDALEHAHENNVIHRDIKPHNILVTKTGKVKVTDFGIAQAATGATMTYSGNIIGSVQYISPEQARGEITTIHTDLYSAGIVLYEMLTGQLPFDGDTAIGIAMKHIQADFPLPSEVQPDLPRELEKVISKAMAKEPGDRYPNALAMKQALGNVHLHLEDNLGTTQVVPKITRKPGDRGLQGSRTTKKKKARPLAWILLIIFLALIPLGFYWAFLQYFKVSEVKMPDLVRKPWTEGEQELRQLGLQAEIVKQRHDSLIPKDYVLAQKPEPGVLIKKTRKVQIELSLGPQLIRVPNVIGFKEREAKVEIINAGLEVAEPVREDYDKSMDKGFVIKQQPGPNEQIAEDSAVYLTVSLGPEPRYISMPGLIGKTLQEARSILEENLLEDGEISNQVSYDYFSGQVISQDIAKEEQVLQGTAVNLVLSLGPGPTPKVANVDLRVEDDGKKHQIRIIVFDRKGEHEEYNEWHDANDFIRIPFPYYGEGIVRTYVDEEMIDEHKLPID